MIEIWDKADCSAYTRKHVASLFDKQVGSNIKSCYDKRLSIKKLARKNVCAKQKVKKSAKSAKSVTPTCKSFKRRNVSELCTRVKTADDLEHSEESDESDLTGLETRSSGGVYLRKSNLHDGYKTFAIESDQRVNLKTTKCLDKSYYEDQVDSSKRKLRMLWTKVTEEFKKDEQMQ